MSQIDVLPILNWMGSIFMYFCLYLFIFKYYFYNHDSLIVLCLVAPLKINKWSPKSSKTDYTKEKKARIMLKKAETFSMNSGHKSPPSPTRVLWQIVGKVYLSTKFFNECTSSAIALFYLCCAWENFIVPLLLPGIIRNTSDCVLQKGTADFSKFPPTSLWRQRKRCVCCCSRNWEELTLTHSPSPTQSLSSSRNYLLLGCLDGSVS